VSDWARVRPQTQAKRQLQRSISMAEGSLQACRDSFEEEEFEEGSESRTSLWERTPMDKTDRVKLAILRKLDRERQIIDNPAKHGPCQDENSDARSRGTTAPKGQSQTAPGDGPAATATSGRGGWARVRTVGKAVNVISGMQTRVSRNGSVDAFEAFHALKTVDAHVGTGPARLESIPLALSVQDLELAGIQQPDVDLSAESFDAGMEMSDLHLETLKAELSVPHSFMFPQHNRAAYRSHTKFPTRMRPSRELEES